MDSNKIMNIFKREGDLIERIDDLTTTLRIVLQHMIDETEERLPEKEHNDFDASTTFLIYEMIAKIEELKDLNRDGRAEFSPAVKRIAEDIKKKTEDQEQKKTAPIASEDEFDLADINSDPLAGWTDEEIKELTSGK